MLLKILGQTFYTSGITHEKQSIVDEAQAKGKINYMQPEYPVSTVLDIVKVFCC